MNNIMRLRMIPFILFFSCFLYGESAPAVSGNIPPVVQAALLKADRLMEKNQAAEAITLLISVQGEYRDHYMVLFTLGNCCMTVGRVKEANTAYLKAVSQNPGYGPAWFNLAKSHMELGQYGPAGDAFLKAYDTYENKNPEALYFAASVYLSGDQPRKGLAAFHRLSSLHPDQIQTEWQQVHVQILIANGMAREALPLIEKLVLSLHGDKQKQWEEFLLYHYLSLKMEPKALTYAESLTRKEPLEPKWWKGVIHIHLTLEQYRDALAAMMVYSRITEPSMEEKKLMADLYLMADIPSPSVTILEDLLRRSYEIALVKKLVYAASISGRPEAGLAWIEKGLAGNDHDIELLMMKGEVLLSAKDYGKAAEAYKSVIRADRNNGKAWLMLGHASWFADDPETAILAVEQARSFPKYRKEAASALAEFTRNRNHPISPGS